MSKSTGTLHRFMKHENSKSEIAAKNLKQLRDGMNINMKQLRKMLRDKSGLLVSEPTFLKWMRDPYYMSIYEIKALCIAMDITAESFINVIFGIASIDVRTSITTVKVK